MTTNAGQDGTQEPRTGGRGSEGGPRREFSLPEIAAACEAFLTVWRDPDAESPAFGRPVRMLLDALPADVSHLAPRDVPHIGAQALRDAADNLDLPGSDATGYYASEAVAGYREAEYHTEAWLRARADALDPEAPR